MQPAADGWFSQALSHITGTINQLHSVQALKI